MISDTRSWFVLSVKSRHEFVAKEELEGKGIETFLPSYRKLSQWKDRKKLIEHPLFPGYVFVNTPDRTEAFLRVLKTRGAVRLLSAEAGRPSPVSSDEIEALQLMIESGRPLDVYCHLSEGSRVRIKRGPLRGAEGFLDAKDDHFIFTVSIDILGRSVSVHLPADDIEEA